METSGVNAQLDKLPSQEMRLGRYLVEEEILDAPERVELDKVSLQILLGQPLATRLDERIAAILERPLDKRNFRRKMLSMGFLEETRQRQRDVPHRAARLYRFDETKYRRLARQGALFEL